MKTRSAEGMIHLIRGLILILLISLPSGSAPLPGAEETVILVHGLGRTPASMLLLAARLEKSGFRVHRYGYPSRTETMEVLVDSLQADLGKRYGIRSSQLHFVTHSMGGILVQSYLARQTGPHQGRVVMLSPPSRGSEIVDVFSGSHLLRKLLGPSGSRLGTGPGSIPDSLPPIRFRLGIITGKRSLNPLGSWLIPGPDDGKVSVDRAELPGASDFLVLPASHTFIMNRKDVADEVVNFLRHGRFRDPVSQVK
ncbi:MAG: alpha/beta fold hydrolase [Candidatus Krumholzibacteria bacterium]|jgi:hypothetical protein|nr:alpha/beta fold hydrolase [Candidatus Krumholzibacteria bacterium]